MKYSVIRVFVSHSLTRLVIYFNISCNQPIKTETTDRDGELARFFLLISFKAQLQRYNLCAITVKESKLILKGKIQIEKYALAYVVFCMGSSGELRQINSD